MAKRLCLTFDLQGRWFGRSKELPGGLLDQMLTKSQRAENSNFNDGN